MKIRQQHAIALAIDEQERLLPAIHNGEEVLQHTELLLKGLRLMDVPILITQQYTKGLRGADCFGSSAPWIRSFSDRRLCFFQKTLRSGDRHPPDGTGGRGCHQL